MRRTGRGGVERSPAAHRPDGGPTLPEEAQLKGQEIPHPDLFKRVIEHYLIRQSTALWCAIPLLETTVGDKSATLTSSVNALQGWGHAGYSAANSAVLGLVCSMTVGLGRHGVRINAIASGTIRRPEMEAEWAHDLDVFDRLADGVPIQRLGGAVDVAEALLVIARDLTHVSGHTLVVDGGQTVMR